MFLQVFVCPQGGVASQHALQVLSQHALQKVSGGWVCAIPACIAGGIPACLAKCLRRVGGCYPSMHCRWYNSMPYNRSPGGGLVWGVWSSGLVSQHALRQTAHRERRLLLRTVRIPLECILVSFNFC